MFFGGVVTKRLSANVFFYTAAPLSDYRILEAGEEKGSCGRDASEPCWQCLPWKMKKTGIILPSRLNLVLFLALKSQQKMLECSTMGVSDVIRLDF